MMQPADLTLTTPATAANNTTRTGVMGPRFRGDDGPWELSCLVFIAHRNFGFSASRSQSPSMFIDSINSASDKPGNATIHHSPANK